MTVVPASIPAEGAVAPARVFGPITRTDIVRYAGASGDFNPIHHDEDYARRVGYPTVFSMGMLQAAMLATYATDWLGAETIRRFEVRFQEQVWPGDTITCSGVVTSVVPETDAVRILVDLSAVRQTGGVAIRGTAIFVLPAAANPPSPSHSTASITN